MHVNTSEEPLYTEIGRKNAADQIEPRMQTRACTIETHFKILEEPLYMEIYLENAAPQTEHPDQAPVLQL